MTDTQHENCMKPARHRTRTGSWRTFERRFQPIDGPNGALHWHRDPLPDNVDPHRVWTILDCDGKLYLSPDSASSIASTTYCAPSPGRRTTSFSRTTVTIDPSG